MSVKDSLIMEAVGSHMMYPHSPDCMDPSHRECKVAEAAADLLRAVDSLQRKERMAPEARLVIQAAEYYASVVLRRD